MAAALQQTPIAFHSRSPPSARIQTNPTIKLSLSSSFKVIRLTVKPPHRRGGRGVSGARMVNTATAAESYAKALADIAIDNSTLAETTDDPTVDDIAKREIVDKLTKSMSLQPHVANFLKILMDMKHIDLIKEILKGFEFIVNRMTNTEVASVVELEPQQLAEISKQVKKLTWAKIVKINMEIDKSLVAGFTIWYRYSGSYFIDMWREENRHELSRYIQAVCEDYEKLACCSSSNSGKTI